MTKPEIDNTLKESNMKKKRTKKKPRQTNRDKFIARLIKLRKQVLARARKYLKDNNLLVK